MIYALAIIGLACAFFLWRWVQAIADIKVLRLQVEKLQQETVNMLTSFEEERRKLMEYAKIDKNTANDLIDRVRKESHKQ